MRILVLPNNRFWKYRIPYRPSVYWYVMGRRMCDRRYSRAIRNGWRCGLYHLLPRELPKNFRASLRALQSGENNDGK